MVSPVSVDACHRAPTLDILHRVEATLHGIEKRFVYLIYRIFA